MTNVNVAVEQLSPIGGATNDGKRIGFLPATAKAAQNDTLTITNAAVVDHVELVDDTTGVGDDATLSGNVITLTNATTGDVRGIVYYK